MEFELSLPSTHKMVSDCLFGVMITASFLALRRKSLKKAVHAVKFSIVQAL